MHSIVWHIPYWYLSLWRIRSTTCKCPYMQRTAWIQRLTRCTWHVFLSFCISARKKNTSGKSFFLFLKKAIHCVLGWKQKDWPNDYRFRKYTHNVWLQHRDSDLLVYCCCYLIFAPFVLGLLCTTTTARWLWKDSSSRPRRKSNVLYA